MSKRKQGGPFSGPFQRKIKTSGRPSSAGRADPRPPKPPNREKAAAAGEWLYGVHAVLAALANPARDLLTLVATPAGASHLPPDSRIRPQIMESEPIAARLPPGAVHQGLALLASPLPELSVEEACAPGPDGRGLAVALDQVTDPHNVGAILRSAAGFGARAVIVTERHAPAVTGVLAKAASGALEHVPLVRVVNLARALEALGRLGYMRYGLAEEGALALDTLARAPLSVLVLGAEGAGLRRLTRERCDALVRLPLTGPIPSLNVSNAAAVALYALSTQN